MKLEPRFSASGTDAMLHFFTRSIDVAYMGIVPFLLGVGNGLPLRCIGFSLDARSTHGIVVRHRVDPTADRIRVAAVFGSSGHFLARRWAETSGVRVSFIDLDPAEMPHALDSGFIDAASVWEPALTRCLGAGRLVASGMDLCDAFPDLVVASDEVCGQSPGELAALVEFHQRMVASLAGGDHHELARTLLGLRKERWETVCANAFVPIDFDVSADSVMRKQIVSLCRDVAEFLEQNGMASFEQVDFEAVVSRLFTTVVGGDDPDTELLRIGYSDDIMCLPLLVGELAGAAEESRFERKSFRPVERLARLPKDMRAELQRVSEILALQPSSGVLELGRMLEDRARRLAAALGIEIGSKSVAAVWTQLEEIGALDAMTATSAHYVRSLRNVAAHAGTVRPDLSDSALDRAIDVYEWLARPIQVAERCGKCRGELKPEWMACPRCGTSRQDKCAACSQDLQPEWSTCPYCAAARR